MESERMHMLNLFRKEKINGGLNEGKIDKRIQQFTILVEESV
jgi:hypothetical protein